MEHIKLFNTHSDYEAFVESENYIEPHVSMCSTEEHTNYNYIEPPFKMVDLGLPSGLLWADRNVGATSPEDYGFYFQWGDTVGYTGDDAKAHSYWSTVPFNGGNEDYDETSINQAITEGKIDVPSGILKPQYDAATVHMGSQYHMPTYEDWQELLAQTNIEITTINGVRGMKYINKSDSSKYIFIPFVGFFDRGQFYDGGGSGDVWSSSLKMDELNYAVFFGFDVLGGTTTGIGKRCYAFCVRGISGASGLTPYNN